jgi:hypothetical protein
VRQRPSRGARPTGPTRRRTRSRWTTNACARSSRRGRTSF